jgi:amidophosphoribosyltransferase
MGGLFGVVSKEDCVMDVYFGSDYHSHLGTRRGGMAIWDGLSFNRAIHNIENVQFRAKFESELFSLKGNMGIGCISDTEPQPLLVRSHLGLYAVSTVGKANNKDELIEKALSLPNVHFMESNKGSVSMTELASVIIDNEDSFKNGLLKVQELISGSCSLLVLTPDGIYASRDRLGRTPLVIGKKKDTFCVASESCTFANLGYTFHYELGPGEIVLLTPDGMMKIAPPREKKKICAFLWVYYGYPSSTYEGTSVELMRYRNGAVMARNDDVWADIVAGVPDSGTGHAIGYSNESKVPYARPFIKYTPTWSRSFMPQEQKVRNLVARMKLMPIPELVSGKRLLLCDDSVVRGTQMRETTDLLYKANAKEVHLRPACPPIVYECKFLNFSASRSVMDLAARRAIAEIEGKEPETIEQYTDPNTEKYHCMVDCIRKRLNLTTLKYQNVGDMLDAIGIGSDNVCTYCWNGKGE